jgi:hypothetical protein
LFLLLRDSRVLGIFGVPDDGPAAVAPPSHAMSISRRVLSRLVLSAALVGAACTDATEPPTLDPIAVAADHRQHGLEKFFGPVRFARDHGRPETETRTISTAGYEAPFVLHVRNGDRRGRHQVSSGTVWLDGEELLDSRDFRRHKREWKIPVQVGASAQLSVKITSKRGSFIDVWVEGKRSTTATFCPSGASGSIPVLQDAIDATPSGGTLLVCDGVHDVSTSTINKPMTLRSQNPNGATLRDQDPPIGPQGNGAFLVIDGVPAGTVRIADIALIVTDGGIRPTGTFDHVEIDDVDVSSPSMPATGNTIVGVRIEGSSVPTARVNVTNSRFSQLTLGVWPIAAVETNVRTSTFDRLTGGGVDFSSGNTATTQSFGRIEDNVFTNCGPTGCVRVLSAGGVVVARNRFEAGDQPLAFGAITVQVAPAMQVPAIDPKIIEDNIIISRASGEDPTRPNGWVFRAGIQLGQPGPGAVIVRRNRITDAFVAINANGANVDAHDNVITGGFRAWTHSSGSDGRYHRNDATGLINSFSGDGSYQCNWWGSAAGPTAPPPDMHPALYTPFAAAPIAGTSIPCDPNDSPAIVYVCPSGGAAVTTLADAMAIVVPGGIVRMCDGSHSVEDVLVDRPITIASAGPGMATLDAGTAARAIRVSGIPQFGTTFLRGLRFVGGTEQNVLFDNALRDNINVRFNEFHPPLTAPYGGALGTRSGLRVTGSSQNLVVQNNTFIGGDVGVHHDAGAAGSFQFNSFSGQANAGLVIEGTGVTPGGAATLNTFTNCGPEYCVRTTRTLQATQNTFTIDIARPTMTPLRIDAIGTGADVVNNTIVGVGNLGADRSLAAHYPITGPAIRMGGAASLRGNRITNAYVGIALEGTVEPDFASVNNTVTRTYAPFAALGAAGSSTFTLSRSDLLDYITTVVNPAGFSALTLRCNYWGSAAGPTDMVAGASVYTPFSAEPIANNAAVPCTP